MTENREENTRRALRKLLTVKRKGHKVRLNGDLYGHMPTADKEMLGRFVKALGVTEIIAIRPSHEMLCSDLWHDHWFDHFELARLADGTVVLISFPYNNRSDEETEEELDALCGRYDIYCVTAKGYSWYNGTLPIIWTSDRPEANILLRRLRKGMKQM